MSSLAVITNGSPEAAALAAWIGRRLPHALITARDDADTSQVVRARLGEKEKRLVLARTTDDALAAKALETVTHWLADSSPFDARAKGADLIERGRKSHAPGSDALDELLARLSPVRLSRSPGRVGRPKGSDPFRGVGFDVCIALLLDPDRRWTDRSMAEVVERTPSAVHKAFTELASRDLVTRGRSGTFVREPLVLRGDLLARWRENTTRRAGKGFRPRDMKEVWALLRRETAPHLLAGTSATVGAWAFTGGPLIAYTTAPGIDALEKTLPPVSASLATLVLWEAQEKGVFLLPEPGTPRRTNKVVTWLDLMVLGGAREREAAEAAWAGDA